MRIATCDLFTNKNTWLLISEDLAQELEKQGVIKILPQYELILPDQVLINHPESPNAQRR